MGKPKQSKFEMIIGAADRFSNVFKGFNDKLDHSRARVDMMKKSMHGLSNATGLSRLTASVGGVSSSIKKASLEGKTFIASMASMAAKTSLLLGGTGAGVLALAKSTSHAGVAVKDASARAGVGMKTWQEYAHAASTAGVSTEQLEQGLRQLQDISIKAFSGGKAQSGLLQMAGINPKTAQGEVKNADSLFMELANKVKTLKDLGQDAKATNLVKSLLGDTGVKFMPMLQGGAEGLKKMRLEAYKLGLVFSENEVKDSSHFNDSLSNLSATFKGLGLSIGKQVLPYLTPLIKKFSEWVEKIRPIVASKFGEWLKTLNIEDIWKSIESGLTTLSKLGSAVSSLSSLFGGLKTTFSLLGIVMASKFLWSLGKVVASLSKFNLVLATNPVGWFLLSCAAIGAAVYAIYKNWDGIVSYFSGLWQGVKEAFSHNWFEGIVKFLVDFNPHRLILKGMNELIAYFTGINLAEVGGKWVGSIKEGFLAQWNNLLAWFRKKVDSLPSGLKKIMGISVKTQGQEKTAIASSPSLAYANNPFLGVKASPLGLSSTVRSIAKTEQIKREEVQIVVKSADGSVVGMQRSGSGESNISLQTGQLATMVY